MRFKTLIVFKPPKRCLGKKQKPGARFAQRLYLGDGCLAITRIVTGKQAIIALGEMPAPAITKLQQTRISLADNEHCAAARQCTLDSLAKPPDQIRIVAGWPNRSRRPSDGTLCAGNGRRGQRFEAGFGWIKGIRVQADGRQIIVFDRRLPFVCLKDSQQLRFKLLLVFGNSNASNIGNRFVPREVLVELKAVKKVLHAPFRKFRMYNRKINIMKNHHRTRLKDIERGVEVQCRPRIGVIGVYEQKFDFVLQIMVGEGARQRRDAEM